MPLSYGKFYHANVLSEMVDARVVDNEDLCCNYVAFYVVLKKVREGFMWMSIKK